MSDEIVTTSFRLPMALKERLDLRARAMGTTASDILRDLLIAHLGEMTAQERSFLALVGQQNDRNEQRKVQSAA